MTKFALDKLHPGTIEDLSKPDTASDATNQRGQRRTRQRDRLRLEVAERTSERNRARKDRERLAKWITDNIEGAHVSRSRSGQWYVTT